MRKSAKVLALYQELRQAVGSHASPAEVLVCATSLVELFAVEDGMPVYELRDGRQPVDMRPVDVALADGGWRTLAREWSGMGWESSYGCGGPGPRQWLTV